MPSFELVSKEHRKNFKVLTDDKRKKHYFDVEIILPSRADSRSAGHDFYAPQEVTIMPRESVLIWTDVKVKLEDNQVLKLYIRSSLGVKYNLELTNQVGIIDASYYSNHDNDGNIGISIRNNSGKAYTIKQGDRIAQGVILEYIAAENARVLSSTRNGGIGSSGK